VTSSVLDLARYPPLPEALLRHSRVVSNRLAALALWPQDAVIAEVGVALGGFSEAILQRCRPRRFLAIDRFDLHELPELWGVSTTEHFGGRTHGEFYRDRFAAEIARGQLEMVKGDSATAISDLPNGGIDLFYVDADHTYDGARRDLEAILPKIKPDGWIVMNDYIPAEIGFSNGPYGVIQATNEFMLAQGWEMVYFALAYVMYCDVGLRRVGSTASDISSDIDAQEVSRAIALKAGQAPAQSPIAEPAVEALKTRVAALEDAMTVIRQSTSWRITAPLRAIARMCARQ
jgi:hypothetical protein